jgi:hypothetical protein
MPKMQEGKSSRGAIHSIGVAFAGEFSMQHWSMVDASAGE